MRRARIVCTIGPSTESDRMIAQLLRSGMDVARLNMSHGSPEWHRGVMRDIRRVSERQGRPVAILCDLEGVRIRTGEVASGGLQLERGRKVLLAAGRGLCRPELIYISLPSLLTDVRPGHRVLLDDGLMELLVTGKDGKRLTALVREGGTLTSRKGVNLPDSTLPSGAFTGKDRRDLELAVSGGADALALSFVTGSGEILAVKRRLARLGRKVPVIAKVERPEAVSRIGEILDAAEGIMVARGDLGVEMSASAVPIIQKNLILKALRSQKLVISATQMLESMRERAVPTRAEAADVANAVLDGTDALMLSAETSTGRYPVEAVRTMARIIEQVEQEGGPYRTALPQADPGSAPPDERSSMAVAAAASQAARGVAARCIVAFTRSGFTAGLLANRRPDVPILALTPRAEVVNRMQMYWGVVPRMVEPLSGIDELLSSMERSLKEGRLAKRSDMVVVTASFPLDVEGKTNFLKVHRVR